MPVQSKKLVRLLLHIHPLFLKDSKAIHELKEEFCKESQYALTWADLACLQGIAMVAKRLPDTSSHVEAAHCRILRTLNVVTVISAEGSDDCVLTMASLACSWFFDLAALACSSHLEIDSTATIKLLCQIYFLKTTICGEFRGLKDILSSYLS
jgi:hypothetical protein